MTRYPSLRVRPIRADAAGVTISGTEYIMTLDDLINLRDILDPIIDHLMDKQAAPIQNDPVYGNFRGNGRWFFRDRSDRLHGPYLSEDAARRALAEVSAATHVPH
jgi:hypothetical protein